MWHRNHSNVDRVATVTTVEGGSVVVRLTFQLFYIQLAQTAPEVYYQQNKELVGDCNTLNIGVFVKQL